jgi:hypothetical protein
MEAVKDMALPDTFAFAWADKATLNSGSYQKFGIGLNLSFALWKVAAD